MKQLFLYLFVFSFLINIFQYISDSRILKDKEQTIEKLNKKIENNQDTIKVLKQKIKTYEQNPV